MNRPHPFRPTPSQWTPPGPLAMRSAQAGFLLVMLTGACAAAEGEPKAHAGPGPAELVGEDAPADTFAHPVEPFDRPVVVFLEATLAEILAQRDRFDDEDDFHVMTDDLMWYRAQAHDALAEAAVAPVLVRERGPLHFEVGGGVRTYDLEEYTFLDLVVAFRPGSEPLVVAPVSVDEVLEYFGRR